MKDIVYQNLSNLGGNYFFKFIPVSHVESIPQAYKSEIHHAVVLKPNSRWFDFYCTKGTIDFLDEQQESKQGDFHLKTISGFVPKDRVDLKNLFDVMMNDKFIVDITDNNGVRKLVGSIDEPLTFKSKFTTGNDVNKRNGYTITFSGEGIKKSPLYNL